MKKNYEIPELLITELDYDILTASSDNDAPYGESTPPTDDGWGGYY